MITKIREDRMTKDERWIALLNRKPLDRIPFFGFAYGFSAINYGVTLAEVYNDPKKAFDAITQTAAKFGWQDLPNIFYASFGAWEFGGDMRWPTGEFDQAPIITRRPINKPEDVEKLEVPDVKKAGIIPLMMEVSKMQEKSGGALIEAVTLGPYGLACSICGLELLSRWMLKEPELVHTIQQKLLPFSIALMQYWVDTFGAERLFPWVGGTAAASNQLISPKQFEKFYLPYQKELYKEVHAMGLKHFYVHICGEQNLNLPYWAQLDYGDPGILSFGHEVDLETAGKYFPTDIIMGNLEPALIQTKTPEEVYELTRNVIEKGRNCPGGFMMAPGCEMPPAAPEENVWAMMQAVSDFGWYE
jgi:uroporphyrinogen decarboxylase